LKPPLSDRGFELFCALGGIQSHRPRDHLIGALAPASDLRRDRDGTGADTHGEADLGVDVASLLAFVFR